MNHAFIFVLGIIHAGFLIAISIRLRNLGFTGKSILKLIAFSLGIWPVVLLIGAAADIPLLWAWAGLPPVIALTLIIYIGIELWVSTENIKSKEDRLREQKEEDIQHNKAIENELMTLATYQVIKTYVGEDQNLVVISDLGKLKAANIHCKIEGAFVKSLLVREVDIESVSRVIDLSELSNEDDQSNQALHQSP